MKLMTNDKYNKLMRTLKQQHEIITNLVKENKALKRDFAHYIAKDISLSKGVIFPNTDERGLGDSGTPLNFPDIF